MTLALPVIEADLDLFAQRLRDDSQSLSRRSISTLQINVGKMCNLACHHCHVEAGPKRTEIMPRQVMAQILAWLDKHAKNLGLHTVDVTGGAPEMNPEFRWFTSECRARGLKVLDRCNLTIMAEPGYETLAQFLADNQVEIVASLPCYLEDNVDKQRGNGVFDESIAALKQLNALGYGKPNSGLVLDLVFNPTGYGLPPAQQSLEADYKRELASRFGIVFNRLWTITNMPIKRFEHALKRDGKYDTYMSKLLAAHNPANVSSVMCRDLVSVGYLGTVYDCDFNQMLAMTLDGPSGDEVTAERHGKKLWDYHPDELLNRPILTGNHCFGCTAGAGSSCGGALA